MLLKVSTWTVFTFDLFSFLMLTWQFPSTRQTLQGCVNCFTVEKYLGRGCSALNGFVFVYGWGSPCEMRLSAVLSEHCIFFVLEVRDEGDVLIKQHCYYLSVHKDTVLFITEQLY